MKSAPEKSRRLAIGVGVAVVAMLTATQESRAQQTDPIPPPLAAPRAQFFRNNPDAWNEFLAQLPRRPAGPPVASTPLSLPPFGGTWQAVATFVPGGAGICNPLLLTDGTVIAAGCNSPNWFKLTPDITGSYVNGTWSKIASLPVIGGTQYAPLYFNSAVLPDGRVIIMGGEYNGSGTVADTKLGAIYDPLSDTWKAVAAPAGSSWAKIGDAESVVLADGTFLLGSCCADPSVDALFDATTLGWTATGAPTNGPGTTVAPLQNEQGYELLPNGNVLTIDIWSKYPANTRFAEQYSPSLGTWSSAGNTPVALADPAKCGNWEIGPAVLRADGTLVAFGGNSNCTGDPTTKDPTAIYDSTGGTWSAGPNVPAACGTTASCTLADAPAALLPNGNILFAAGAGYAKAPTHFFEFTSANAIDQVADTVFNAASSPSYLYDFLVLPNGQIFETDQSEAPELYTPTGTASGSWAPVISTAPSAVYAGATYPISGSQFNGLSQAAYYGDDVQAATNYPLVQITNSASGHVLYARTFNHSTMSIAPSTAGSTNFTVPDNLETGPSTLVVIANGIASSPVSVAGEHSAFAQPPDFNGDHDSDILWHNNADGDTQIWLMKTVTNSVAVASKIDLGVVPTAMSIVGTGDFNGDHDSDILWRNDDGDVQIWFMNGGTVSSKGDLGILTKAWSVVGTGDFNKDGTSDILWRNATTGQLQLWLMSGGTVSSTINVAGPSTAWTVVGIADFNGDGRSDILWRNNTTGGVQLWLMNGGTVSSKIQVGTLSTAWTVAGTGDFNSDSIPDILWRNDATGGVLVWLMNGLTGKVSSTVHLSTVSTAWTIDGTSDFNGDGKTDILWRNANGAVLIWLMNGSTISKQVSLGTVTTAQTVVQ